VAGLSSDELQFIAEFLGAWILEPAENCRYSQAGLVQRLAELQRNLVRHPRILREDQEHKMILLLEYLYRSGMLESSMTARAGQAESATG
jgi:hypothetical protein